MLSANTLAQIPAGSVSPALSPPHFAAKVVSAAPAESPFRLSPELHATIAAARKMVARLRRTTGSGARRIRSSFERLDWRWDGAFGRNIEARAKFLGQGTVRFRLAGRPNQRAACH